MFRLLFLLLIAFVTVRSVLRLARAVVAGLREDREQTVRMRAHLARERQRIEAERGAETPPFLAAFGLGSRATPDEVLAAYRQLAMQLHPDRGGDPNEFKRLHRHFEKAMAYAEGRIRKPR